MVAPVIPLSDYEASQIADFVSRGNRLVYIDFFGLRSGRTLLSKFHLTTRDSQSLSDGEFELANDIPSRQFVKKLVLTAEARIEGGTIIARDPYGAIIVETSHGKGKCLVISSPGICANRRLGEPRSAGNFQFLTNWIGESGGPLYFDEKCHGHTQAPSLLYFLAHGPVGTTSGQLVLIFFVAVVSLNQRFGKKQSYVKLRHIANLEFIEGMAQTFRKARARDTAACILFHGFKSRLCKTLGISPEAHESVLALSWSQTCDIQESRCFQFLQKGNAITKGERLSTDQLLAFIRELDQLVEKTQVAINLTRRLGA